MNKFIVCSAIVFSALGNLFAADVLDQVTVNCGREKNVPVIRKNGGITVTTTKPKASFVFEHKDALPPKGSVITFRFTLKSEKSHNISFRDSCKLKEGDYAFAKEKSHVSEKEKEYTYSMLWKFGADEISTTPKFAIMLWEPGTYTLSSMDYSYADILKEGATTLPLLEGSLPLNSPYIEFEGSRYVQKYPDHIEVSRFRKSYYEMDGSDLGFSPNKARGTSGITLALYTESPSVTLSWGIEPHFANDVLDFGLLLDGKLQETNYAKRMTDRSQPFNFTFKTGAKKGQPVLCELTYPSYANPYLLGVVLEEGAKLLPVPENNKKVYVAFGDSITQGTGQKGATHRTWAWQFAQLNDLELFNLAVGGGKVSVKAGEMLADWPHVDVVTILIGFNDCMGGGRSVEEYSTSYNALLNAIRKNHPETKIICISPTYPIDAKSKKTGIALNEFRKAVVKIVEERKAAGDSKIELVQGEKLTPSNGGVHFSNEGAKAFAQALSGEVNRRNLLD